MAGAAEAPLRLVHEAPLDAALARVRRRTAAATAAVAAGGVACGVVLVAFDPQLALLPVAFVLGWLNLVGL
ncbi:MAG TPA: hypothetical protein VF529_13710 [Solirubrobacteraceae bacterium]|jgi:ferric-dicitrate binding protein FerR (iron transport regulator)